MNKNSNNENKILEKLINQITKDKKLYKAIDYIADIYFEDKTTLKEDLNYLVDEKIFESNYSLEPFAKNAAGDFYVLLNNKYVGYISHEGTCGIVALSVEDFFKIIGKIPYIIPSINKTLLESIDNFINFYNDEIEEVKNDQDGLKELNTVNKFLKENILEEDITKIYEIVKKAVEKEPNLSITVKEGVKDYVDYDNLLDTNDEQVKLTLIEKIKYFFKYKTWI